MLLTPPQKANAEIASLGQTIAAHLAAAASAANRQAAAVLALSTPQLTEWLRTGDHDTLFEAHAALGVAINTAAATAAAVMASTEITVPCGSVDVRPVSEKLADQQRGIRLDGDGQIEAYDLPAPEPQPEPEPEP